MQASHETLVTFRLAGSKQALILRPVFVDGRGPYSFVLDTGATSMVSNELADAVKELLGHSSITITMRYTHTNLDSKHAAVARLEVFGDSLVTVCTKMQQLKDKVSLKAGISYNVSAR